MQKGNYLHIEGLGREITLDNHDLDTLRNLIQENEPWFRSEGAGSYGKQLYGKLQPLLQMHGAEQTQTAGAGVGGGQTPQGSGGGDQRT